MIRSIVHISDQHCSDPRHRDVSADDSKALARAIVDREDPDRTVIVDSGDWTGSGFKSQFDKARPVADIYTDAGFEVFSAPGNHDVGIQGMIDRRESREAWHDFARALARVSPETYPPVYWPFVRDFEGFRLIVANSCITATKLARGRLGDDQIESIADFAKTADAPAVLAVHHCLSADGVGESWTRALADRDDLKDQIKDTVGASIDLMLTGHLHRGAQWSDVFGADRLIASPMSAKVGKYRKIRLDSGEVDARMIEV